MTINSSSPLLEISYPQNRVIEVSLNNPDKFNAFDDSLIAAMTDVFEQVANNLDIRVLVLSAQGKHFSAGADLAWMQRMADYTLEQNQQDAMALANMLYKLNHLPQATIAKVQGAAFGGAVGLVSCCDMAIATDNASFCLSEVKLGLIPATISPYVMQAMGARASRRYFQTAERFKAETALKLGLVDDVVPQDSLSETVSNRCDLILSNGPHAVRKAKALVLDFQHQAVDHKMLLQTSERIAEVRVSDEGQEGLQAFFNKRPASWLSDKE
ncbi:enoyl-CoA hydratase/isomerase family protein [Thalassotalea mangrovi]|uniref:Enoyl-CoA hydratase/isomerase family protein n=1 Tax=Thalassotalea mangrovi TaxID=2572245 RepID=A0A4U1B1E8_9GAMM|nr:enoyl-CoA hydratase/isomerase family protein [Thalassotalea mangrovi]TKB43092.1 enoyl-CoA hydratase/isomerase family protein [Thalassotalea mangrovi]